MVPELSREAGLWFARNMLIPFTRAVLEEVENELAAEITATVKKTFSIPSWLGKGLFH